MGVAKIDKQLIITLRKLFLPTARVAIFIIYFWFGALKLFNLSPAEPLGWALIAKTVGVTHFELMFKILAVYECLIGILFLLPKYTRIVIPLLIIHMLIVCSPLLLVPELTWDKFLVPTLQGQYIIKNVAVIALAIGIAAQTTPINTRKNKA